MSLSNYLQDSRSLLFDSLGLFTPDQQLIRWINLGRRQAAQRTGCIQRMITGQSAFGASAQPGSIIPGGMQPGALPGAFANAQQNAPQNSFQAYVGIERYPYQLFANPYLKTQHAGCESVIDVLSVSVSWGSIRPSLAWMPYMDLQAYARAYATLVTSYPYFWSTLNDGENGEVWLFPVPSQTMEMEWQVYAVPSDLNTDSDYDALPKGFTNSVKFYAAAMAFLGRNKFLQAQLMMNSFTDALGIARTAVDSGKVSNYYYTAFN